MYAIVYIIHTLDYSTCSQILFVYNIVLILKCCRGVKRIKMEMILKYGEAYLMRDDIFSYTLYASANDGTECMLSISNSNYQAISTDWFE